MCGTVVSNYGKRIVSDYGIKEELLTHYIKQKREHISAPFFGYLTHENKISSRVTRVRIDLTVNGLKGHCRDSLSVYKNNI